MGTQASRALGRLALVADQAAEQKRHQDSQHQLQIQRREAWPDHAGNPIRTTIGQRGVPWRFGGSFGASRGRLYGGASM